VIYKIIATFRKTVEACAQFLIKTQLRATVHHLPYEITQLCATRYSWICPTYSQAREAGTRFTYPGEMKGWADLATGYITRWFTCPQTVSHPTSNHLIATQLEVKPVTSLDHKYNPAVTSPSDH